MALPKDWLPGTRNAIIAMVKAWLTMFLTKLQLWGIPSEVSENLSALASKADDALTTAKNEFTRTPVATAQCKEAFDALTDAMRDVKRRYFLSPPLIDSDYVALGLKPPDTTHTASRVPTAQVQVETFLVGRHELGVRFIYVTGSPDDPENKGYRIWYSVLAQGETPPASPEDLRKSFFTQRKKDVIQFDFEDSGKIAYFAVQVENSSGKQGPWGPIVSALIP
ncbi:MAG: hypothetical protein LBC46_02765 [Treponema sp.]|nr:hypothetical protein [Treponema sp.]